MNREEKKRATRQKIIDCALELFAENGYEATTVHQITERAGVAKGTFFNYFENKEEVLCDLQLFIATEEISKLQYKQGPIIPLMRELLMEMLRHLPFNRSLILASFQCTLSNKKLLESATVKFEEFKQVLIPVIAAAQARGEISSVMPAEMIADLAVQNYQGALIYWGMGLGEDKLSNQVTLSFELFFKGLAP
ncbi:TetR/AcrR family transcriptional regulator [Paenibacillus sedimenti]|uniref:TetR/AcrR family transcriptional regulator n=1 Tax=Paenibacillus sedimenti TaxID=2770274 RepID=A0A926QMH0_9BACL|nr:TetR/AcrR family transcriptional regulator [Paenibacillus sedimenti]MBD0383379.1 TetR/AcrR family transcriptional regulator [Paenibacillus sedimenti]